MARKKTKPLKLQLTELKGKVSKLLSYEMLFDYEEEVLESLYELINNILLEKVDDKYYTMEEIVDTRLMEYTIILEASENKKVKEIKDILKGGLNW